jgi:reactive intermediate/imine deaminase
MIKTEIWISVSVLLAALLIGTNVGGKSQDVEYLGTSPDWPFSTAVRVGKTLYLSGNLAYDAETKSLVPGGIGPETRKTMDLIKANVEKYGSSMDRVVKCTVFLADISEWAAMNEIYVEYFPEGHRPARSALGSSGLALGARTEIECIAIIE